jgi:hypothetical protein
MEKDYLVLKRALASRPSGEWSDDDHDVLADDVVIGRMFKVRLARGCDGRIRQELAAGMNENSEGESSCSPQAMQGIAEENHDDTQTHRRRHRRPRCVGHSRSCRPPGIECFDSSKEWNLPLSAPLRTCKPPWRGVLLLKRRCEDKLPALGEDRVSLRGSLRAQTGLRRAR